MKTLTATLGNDTDTDYHEYLARVNARFLRNTEGGAPLFTTDAEDLWETYLASFEDPAIRQHHNCHACRRFIETFGGLVTIDESGSPAPAIWNPEDAPEECLPAIEALAKRVRRAKITGVFLCSEPKWGTPQTGVWRHLSVTPPKARIYARKILTAGQAMAEKREDYKNIRRALSEFTGPQLATAVRLLKTDALYRSEKILGQAEWLDSLHAVRKNTNLVWRAVASAPAGFCHPRAGMLGTLLEDIAAGKDFDAVAKAFAAKMHPLAYQRPQAAPSEGAIAAAEKIVAQLGAAGSLARRFARLEDVRPIWTPTKDAPAPADGVFSHLKAKGAAEPSLKIPAQTMTWDKFQRTVLPTANKIEILVPNHGKFAVMVTAVNPEAPLIFRWDHPVSWYFWHGGSFAREFNLSPRYVAIDAIVPNPASWGSEKRSNQTEAVMFAISGARETKQAGAAIFPENLRSEFHGIRSVIEAYSQAAKIEDTGSPHVAGLVLAKTGDIRLRVWAGTSSLDYNLDRWD